MRYQTTALYPTLMERLAAALTFKWRRYDVYKVHEEMVFIAFATVNSIPPFNTSYRIANNLDTDQTPIGSCLIRVHSVCIHGKSLLYKM